MISIPDKKNILSSLEDILSLDKSIFDPEYKSLAWNYLKQHNKKQVYVSGLLGISNICENNCLYCGLRRERKIKRYRIDFNTIEEIISQLREYELQRIFFVSGEDSSFKINDYIKLIEMAKSYDLEVNLAAGVFPLTAYREMKTAGLDIYTLKFESSNESIFNMCKPDITFRKRLDAIENVRTAGLKLGSANIVGLKNQTLKDLVDDIKLMIDLDIDWAPIVPYMPTPDTPMAEETPMGDIDLILKIIALLRILLPNSRITAAQPRAGSTLGFADPEGNRHALEHGANAMFVELTPFALAGQFNITSARKLPRLEEIKTLIDSMALKII